MFSLTRRQTIGALAAGAAIPLIRGSAASSATSNEAHANALLARFADNLLTLSPETATSLGVDTGKRAELRYHLGNRSVLGERRFASIIASDLAVAEAIDTRGLSFPVRTSIEVVKSAYRTGLKGFDFPFGDVAVGGYRNTPYPVNQAGGAFIDTPQLLTTDQPLETAQDAEAFVSRLNEYPAQLDGELERIREGRQRGMIPPNFIIARTIAQLEIALDDARKGGSVLETLTKKLMPVG